MATLAELWAQLHREIERNPLLAAMDPRDFAAGMTTAPSAGAASIGSGFIPVAGDVLGLTQDAVMYANDPESRRWQNYLLSAVGVLPFVPAAAGAAKKVALGAYPTTTPARIVNQTERAGGYSVNLATGKTPEGGLLVGKFANDDPRNTVIEPGQKLRRADVQAHAAKNAKALERDDSFFGTWRDPESGKVYFDVSRWFPGEDKRLAVKFGERTKQISGYDATSGETFPIGDWEKFIQSPEFHNRMAHMERVGRDYLSNHAAKEWWDMHGSAFERVYGPQALDRLAGFIASTAPNAAPRENLQTATEYMRRYIKNEDVIQPDWRVPEGQMTRQAGTQIGMEQSRAANLQKSAAGDLAALRQDKVREEAAALMGDPSSVVLDRHWARIAEDPSRGILADVAEGKIAPGEAYQLLKKEVTAAAEKAGRSPRDYSADVWTGIRETIRTKSELFGTKYRGSAITSESKSYADHFEDLIRDKANHLGITPAEMESRLRAGDATLLSLILASPVGAAIYRESVRDEGAGSPSSTG